MHDFVGVKIDKSYSLSSFSRVLGPFYTLHIKPNYTGFVAVGSNNPTDIPIDEPLDAGLCDFFNLDSGRKVLIEVFDNYIDVHLAKLPSKVDEKLITRAYVEIAKIKSFLSANKAKGKPKLTNLELLFERLFESFEKSERFRRTVVHYTTTTDQG